MALFITQKGKQKRLKELESKFHYYHSLLVAECMGIIQRLEVISHSNLVYSQYHTENLKIYLDILNKETKWCEKCIETLDDHILDPKKPNFKENYVTASQALENFRMKVINLNEKLREIIRPEEEARGKALLVKEYVAYVKKKYYANNNTFEVATPAFDKLFAAVEKKFEKFDKYIDSAEYDFALAMLPKIKKVLEEMNRLCEVLPKICLTATNDVPALIERAYQIYETLDSKKLPLLYLNPKRTLKLFKEENNAVIDCIKNLKADEANRRIIALGEQVSEFISSLNKEEESKDFYDENFNKIYDFADSLGKKIINIYNDIPNIRKAYKFDEFHDNILEQLQDKSSKLNEAKRGVDVNIFTTSRQPYSLIIEKLKVLDEVNREIEDFLILFNAYLKSLKDDCVLAFSLISVEYANLRKNVVLFETLKIEDIDKKNAFIYLYSLLDDITELLKSKPVDVITLNKKVNEYKKLSVELFETINVLNEKKTQCEKYIELLNQIRSDFETIDINMTSAEDLYAKSQYKEAYLILDKLYKDNSNFSKNDLFR